MNQVDAKTAYGMVFGDLPTNTIVVGIGPDTFDPIRFIKRCADGAAVSDPWEVRRTGGALFPLMYTRWDIVAPHDLSADRVLPFIFSHEERENPPYGVISCRRALLDACLHELERHLRRRGGSCTVAIPSWRRQLAQVFSLRQGERIHLVSFSLVPTPNDRGYA